MTLRGENQETEKIVLRILFNLQIMLEKSRKDVGRFFDTKHQLADVLTKGNFTRDEWNNLLHLINISQFSFICCSQNFSSIGCPETMAKRMQEEKGEERIVVKLNRR